MCVMFGRMLAMFWMSSGEAGRGGNLERTSSQDPTRCSSCSPIKHEILSAGRWFIILLLLLGENTERARDREREWGRAFEIRMYFFLCQQIPEWFPDFDYFSFFDGNNLEEKESRGGEEHLAFGRAVGLGAMVLADIMFAWVYKIIRGNRHIMESHIAWRSHMHLPLHGGQQLSAIHQFGFREKLKLMVCCCSQSGGLGA